MMTATALKTPGHPRVQGAYFDDDSDGIEDSGSSPRAGSLPRRSFGA